MGPDFGGTAGGRPRVVLVLKCPTQARRKKDFLFELINHAKELSLRSTSSTNTARGSGWSMYYVVYGV